MTPFVAEVSSRPAPSRPGVLVMADEGLVAETVASALRRRGFLTEHVVLGAATEHGRPDVALVVADVGSPRRLGALRTAVAGAGTPWVLVTTTERGPWWGAALEAGASEVVECTSSLREVDLALRLAAAGHRSVEPQAVAELVAAWSRVRRERTSVERRIAQLSPRELEVLDSLFAGTSVAEIAVAAGVSEATVRTQVRAVLRKLHVRSQLAAVALYAAVLEDS